MDLVHHYLLQQDFGGSLNQKRAQLENQNVLVVLTADHECGGVAVHDSKDASLDIHFTSDYHSANFVPIWATGPGAEVFDAFMDNTEIGKMLIEYIKK